MARSTATRCTLTLIAVGAVLLAFPSRQSEPPAKEAPRFRLYPAGETRKAAFFNFLGPIIDAENERWRARRERLLSLREGTLSTADRLWLEAEAAFFDLPSELDDAPLLDALLVHVDTVPRSLALAQAAKESAWGTARFAREGHNYFGQRCFQKGCGIVPDSRRPGAKFEVRRFASARASVVSYLNNINSHREYAGLRAYRAEQRRLGRPVSGLRAAEEIAQYSERRKAYVDEIQSLIHFNGLEAPGPDRYGES